MHLRRGKRPGSLRAFWLSLCFCLPWLAIAAVCPCLLAGHVDSQPGKAVEASARCCSSCCPATGANGQRQPGAPEKNRAVACGVTLQATLQAVTGSPAPSVHGHGVRPPPDPMLSMLLRANYLRQVACAVHLGGPPLPPSDGFTFAQIVSRRCFPSNAPPPRPSFLS